MKKYILLTLIIGLFAACNETEAPKTENTTTTTTPAPKAEQGQEFPSVELKVLENLWEKADFVDYVYYKLPISASLDNPKSIKSAIAHIAENPAVKSPNCKAIGRVFYQIEGENALQGDIFFSQGCTYFLWVDDKGKYYAGNQMMDSAIQFFQNNIQAAAGVVPGQGK